MATTFDRQGRTKLCNIEKKCLTTAPVLALSNFNKLFKADWILL